MVESFQTVDNNLKPLGFVHNAPGLVWSRSGVADIKVWFDDWLAMTVVIVTNAKGVELTHVARDLGEVVGLVEMIDHVTTQA